MSDLNEIKISEHFKLSEFECKGGDCCGFSVKVRPELLLGLEALRQSLTRQREQDTPLYISSAYRCPQHNKAVGGKHHSLDPRDPLNSFHCRAMAADLAGSGVSKILIAKHALKIFPRVGLYWKQSRHGKILVLHVDIADPVGGLPALWGDAWPT